MDLSLEFGLKVHSMNVVTVRPAVSRDGDGDRRRSLYIVLTLFSVSFWFQWWPRPNYGHPQPNRFASAGIRVGSRRLAQIGGYIHA